jgi:Mitochondrial biogenesis AIM24
MSALPKKDDKPVLHASGWDEVVLPKPETTFYAVTGNESQVLTVKLAPGDTLHGEPGSMFYLSDGMKQSVTCDECCARCCTGEDVRVYPRRTVSHQDLM